MQNALRGLQDVNVELSIGKELCDLDDVGDLVCLLESAD